MRKRIYKFRAWDLEKKEWIGDNGTTFTSESPKEGVVALLLSGNLRVFSAEYTRAEKKEDDFVSISHSEFESIHPCDTKPAYKRQYVLQQYTGLKDKNGKEIWEEDIVKYEIDSYVVKEFPNSFLTGISKVFWESGSFRIYLKHKSDVAWQPTLGNYGGIKTEVIGNIYQDKNLLT